jgi:enoyl-CoA hydratase
MSPILSRDGDLAVLTLNRPDKLNTLSFDVLREIDRLLADPVVRGARALIVTGAGDRAFCAGADIEELRGRRLVEQRDGAVFGQSVFQRLAQLPIISIAAINGYALGGGLELALACTFRVASPKTRMALPEIKLGLIPGYGGTQRLARLIGESRALELILTGRTLLADEAQRIGLVNRVADDAFVAAKALAAEVTGYSLPAVSFARDSVSRGLDLSLIDGLKLEADLSTLAYQTEDAEEGLAAFIDKRRPEFRDA